MASYAQLGRMSEAKVVLEHLKQNIRIASLNLAFYRAISQFKHAADLDHYLDGLRKAGVPEWLFGFVPREENRLSGDEIKAKIKGQEQIGTSFKGTPYTIRPTSDRTGVFENSRSQKTFTSMVEGDSLCLQYPTILLGRKLCHSIYRNPDGSHKEQNEYISVGPFTVRYFSVQP